MFNVWMLCSKAEMFIHVAIQNLHTQSSGKQLENRHFWSMAFPTTLVKYVSGRLKFTVCCMSNHFSKICSQIRLEIHCFSVMSGHLSLPIVSTEYHTGTTESRHTLLIVSYIDQFNLTLSNDVMMIPVCRKCRVSGLIVSFPARKIGGKIRLVTLCTILGTSMYFHGTSSGR